MAPAHYSVAGSLMVSGRIEEAIAHYERALALKPDYTEASVDLGNALQAFAGRS